MLDRFARTQLLLGPDAMQRLAHARVAVFGLGGVGGTAAEALARSGVGAIDVIDHDKVSLTNMNRQTVALGSTIGLFKADVMVQRILDINPACKATAHRCFYLPDTAGELDLSRFDYVVDAVDTVTAKLLLIEGCQATGTPLISCMGTANKINPTALTVGDIYQTSICPLAKIIRKECRKRGVRHLKVVYSTEPARQPSAQAQDDYRTREQFASGDVCDKFGRAGIPGSVSFVPPVAGLIMAGEVVKELAGIGYNDSR